MPRTARTAATALVFTLTTGLTLAGCSSDSPSASHSSKVKEYSPPGDIPDEQVFLRFAPPSKVVTIKVPEGWAKTEQDGAISFTDKLNTIRIETHPMRKAPTPDTVRTEEMPEVAKALKHYQLQEVSSVDRAGGSVVRATYRADSPVDAVTGKVVSDAFERYAYWKNGTEAVLTLSGPVGADNVDPWRLVSDSVTWH